MLLARGSGKASAVAAEVAVAGTGFGAVPVFYASPLSSFVVVVLVVVMRPRRRRRRRSMSGTSRKDDLCCI